MAGGRAPITIGIQPQIAFYSLLLGGACAVAAYTEKYRRDQDEIDDRLKEQYYANMREQQAKTPRITQTIRGQDMRLDGAMNKWVWGGKASIGEGEKGGGNGGGGGRNSDLAAASNPSSEGDDSSSSEDEEWDSSSSSSDVESEEERQLSKKERKKRRKERKRKREERRKKKLEAERQKIMVQSLAAGAAVGAVAIGASIFLSSRK